MEKILPFSKNEIDYLRNLDQILVAQKLGMKESGIDKNKYSNGVVTICISPTKGIWSDFKNQRSSMSAIDLVIYINNTDFKSAINFLSNIKKITKPSYHKKIIQEKRKIFLVPPKTTRTEQARAYLQGRGINNSVVSELFSNQTIYQDKYNNIVFLMKKNGRVAGAELVGTGNKRFKGLATGSDKSAFFYYQTHKNITKIAICESALDAIAYSQRTGITAISSAGSPIKLFFETVDNYCIQNNIETLYLAFDNDTAGEEFSELAINNINIQSIRDRPNFKDPIEDLRLRTQLIT